MNDTEKQVKGVCTLHCRCHDIATNMEIEWEIVNFFVLYQELEGKFDSTLVCLSHLSI